MYLQTLVISDFDTEKAEAVFCHEKVPNFTNLFSLMKFSELAAMTSANLCSEILGAFETKKCACSGFI